MIEVLWIDDECIEDSSNLSPMGEEFVNYAYDRGIMITPMLTYKEGIEAIKNNPLKWCAVILDIHSQKATTGNPSDGFDEAREEIARFQAVHNQTEPYVFVLSGNKQYQTDSSILRRLPYCSKNIYDKNGDYELLFKDILKIQNVSNLYRCQSQYSDVLINAKDFCGCDTWKKMLQLLYEITVNNVNNNPSLFNDMRKILEDIMEGLKQHGYSYFIDTKEKLSLNNFSVYIGKDSTIPEYIQRSFHALVRVVQDGSHSNTVQTANRMEVDIDVSNLKAPYLLRSCLYELCNILIWMGYIFKQKEIC